MKIKAYQSEQFAGVRNREITFSDGMNVVLGDNEAGKSTLISGIYMTLMKNTKLKKSSNEGEKFFETYMPSNGASTIDGKVVFEHDNRKTTVEKIWGMDSKESSIKADIDDVLYRGAEAESALRNELQYSEALYQNVVFGWQENADLVLEWIFNAKDKEGKAELEAKLKEALSISDGISIDKLEELLHNKISILSERWDVGRNTPEKNRGIHDKWRIDEKKVNILNAYYAWQEEVECFDESKNKIENLEHMEKNLAEAKTNKDTAERQLTEFLNDQARLVQIASWAEAKKRAEDDQKQYSEAKKNWPEYIQWKREAETFRQEAKAKKAKEKLDELDKKIDNLKDIDRTIAGLQKECDGREQLPEAYIDFLNYEREKEKANTRMNSSALHTKIVLMNGHTAEIETGTQQFAAVSGQEFDATGYMKLTIPNVGEILVSPENVDVESLKQNIKEYDKKMRDILEQYQVADGQALKTIRDKYILDSSALEGNLKTKIDLVPLEELERQKSEIVFDETITVREQLDSCIQTFLQDRKFDTLDGCIAVWEDKIDQYVRDHETQEFLGEKINNLQTEIDDYQRKIDDSKIENEQMLSEQELNKKKQDLEIAKHDTEKNYIDMRDKVRDLERAIGEIDLTALEQSCKDKEALWSQRVTLCKNYMKIAEDLQEIKNKNNSNPMDVFYHTLADNLAFITDGQIQLGDITDKYSIRLTSGKNTLLQKKHLSEGTRKTILLAYRLAVLKHFFPDNNGLLVLDDIILDMDPGRREKSVQLLQRYAEQNQVIFTTCDPQIAHMLGGTIIRI